MKKTLFLILIVLSAISCGRKAEYNNLAGYQASLSRAPEEIESEIQKKFPGAMIAPEAADSILKHLFRVYKIDRDKLLFGASTCVDDIIFTKNFHMHPEVKGPFHLGGLAGLPFTGISGLEALAHHIPDSGTMILLVEPHIGYSEKRGWGFVLRHEQQQASSCCGALMGTLSKLQKGTLKGGITEDDYQGDKIAELARLHEKEILESENPIIELTRLTSVEAERQIRAHVLEVDLSQVKYIVIITGVLIDTDYMYSDYQYFDHILVYDVRKKVFVEESKKTFGQ